MTVIDLNTSTVSVTDGKYLEQLRNAADRADAC